MSGDFICWKDEVMSRPSSYPRELRESAIRMVAESKADYASEFEAITSVAKKLGIGSPETLRKWIRRAEVDAGQRPGVTTEEWGASLRRSGTPTPSPGDASSFKGSFTKFMGRMSLRFWRGQVSEISRRSNGNPGLS
jgi:transposase